MILQTVDWNNGRAGRRREDINHCQSSLTKSVVVGDNESEIMKMIAQLPKETDQV